MRGILGLFIVLWYSTAQAQSCGGSFQAGYSAPPITIDPFSSSDTTITSTLPISVNMNGNNTCNYTITFFSDVTLSTTKRTLISGTNAAYYYLQDSAQNTLTSSISATSASARLNFSVSGKTQTQANPQYTFRFAATDIAPTGTYTGTITATLYRVNGGTRTQLSQLIYPVTAVVTNGMLVSLGNLQPSGGGFAVLDLGELYSGLQNTATISLRSNNPYTVTMSSQNGSVLKLSGATGANAEIPYTAQFNGTTVRLTSGNTTVLNSNTATNAQGQSYPLVITVPDVTNKYSGQYIDQLTITVEAR